jgi:glycosyltransferase involved in cell wall biosynthesis
LVTEYNGSEVWINRHWGRALANEGVAASVEHLNLCGADLVVVVSEALRQELTERGVEQRRILVNPNGVDPDRYHPGVDGTAVRRQLGIGEAVVIGFVGTFGPWHGAEVLAEAARELLFNHPDSPWCFLFIGDGQRMPAVRRVLAGPGVEDHCRFAGLVPQSEGPSYMAACDILVAPHVPNADGSPFFGSPTKLFEYMAMGKPIVASDLDQIGDVLSDGHDALLVEPGDPSALAGAIQWLADTPGLAQRLASNARQTALDRHTWRRHTQRILSSLDEVVDAR